MSAAAEAEEEIETSCAKGTERETERRDQEGAMNEPIVRCADEPATSPLAREWSDR